MSETKVEQYSREQDKLPEQALVSFLSEHTVDIFPNLKHQTLIIKQLEGGASNLTYRLSVGDHTCILRRPPAGTKAKTAHDMVREYRVLSAVKPSYDFAPKVYVLCEDESVIGFQFFLMEEVVGLKIGRRLPVETTSEQNSALCENWVERFTQLHLVDITNASIAELGKPEGYITRQFEGWRSRYQKAKTDDVPDIEFLADWLSKNLPKENIKNCLIHNDFKFDNFILNENDPTNIIGVLDWEMSTLGDPLMDLGCSLAYWVQADDPVEMQMIRRMPTHLPGMYSRRELFDNYCDKMGFKDLSMTPYYVFGLFRLAGIAQQIYYRYYHGQTKNPMFKDFGKLVAILIAAGIKAIRAHEDKIKKESSVVKRKAKDLFDLTGKVALITGASRGIGESVAKLFVENGARVIISSRNQEALDELAKEISKESENENVTAIACHIGETEAMENLLEKVKQQFGKIDILINNAATNPFFGELLDTPDSAIEKTIDVNIKGYLKMSQMVGKMMRDAGGGSIINTASVNGAIPAPMQGIYSMTKATVMSMTASMAKESAKYNIRVNAVLPGLTDTHFASALTKNEKMLKMILPMIPMARMAQPEEIAPAFLFLASDAASYVTGINLPVDGGLLA